MGKSTLIAPIGTEAQIVTTTIDLLHARRDTIDEVIVLHSVGDPQLEAAADRLKVELAIYPDLSFTVKPFSDKGDTVSNMDTQDEVAIMFYSMFREVRDAKNCGNTVYLLCSGGRKIVAAYAMLTAQMLFDADDNLIYLISKGEYLRSKAMHPGSAEDYRDLCLLDLPFLEWSAVFPSVSDIRACKDPVEAYAKIRDLQLELKYGRGYDFIEKQCTKAERRVLRLAAGRGLTNAQIAAELYISERTVESHMRAMLRKAAFYFEEPEITRAQLIVLTQTYYQMKLKEGAL